MKKIILLCFVALLMSGCGTDYSEKGFSKLKDLATNNSEKAINELKIFIYHNPKHAESKVLLGELLIAKPKVEEREMYLAQFYLKQAMSSADENLSAEAEGLILQAQLRRGLAPGDPVSLVNLAKFAAEKKRYTRSVQLYLRASYEYLYTEELTQARDMAIDALKISNKYLIDLNPETWTNEYQEALALLTAIKMARGRVGEARGYLVQLKELNKNLDNDYERLPSLELLNAMVQVTEKVSRQGILTWRPGFMQSENSENKDSEQTTLKMLAKAEDHNKDYVNDLRTMMSFHVWTAFQSTLDKTKYPQIATFVEENISFYEKRM